MYVDVQWFTYAYEKFDAPFLHSIFKHIKKIWVQTWQSLENVLWQCHCLDSGWAGAPSNVFLSTIEMLSMVPCKTASPLKNIKCNLVIKNITTLPVDARIAYFSSFKQCNYIGLIWDIVTHYNHKNFERHNKMLNKSLVCAFLFFFSNLGLLIESKNKWEQFLKLKFVLFVVLLMIAAPGILGSKKYF